MRAISILCAALLLAAGGPAAWAQPRADYTNLSLDELMALDVITINVLGTHIHPAGEWMVGYEYMFDSMDGNLSGTRRVGTSQILDTYNAAPTDMSMQMHMVMLMYSPSNDLTLMGMLPYLIKSMHHVLRDGTRFSERSEGPGDLELHALYTFFSTEDRRQRLLVNAGLSLPTGSIDRSMDGVRLEYPMQLGSGTVDLMPGLTYLGQMEVMAWGVELHPRFRVGNNRHDYRLGNLYRLSGWTALRLTQSLSLSGRVDAQAWGDIHGRDPTLDPTDEPTKDVSAQGGRRVDLMLGLNAFFPGGGFRGLRLALEAGAPVYQWLHGPQPETTWLARVGLQWTF
ncbi:MAG TPA: transporter [Casimicrobiaceae bacterium]